ncbi:hypothetical protein CKALI_00690 [Corynebacterium kalinowskii]|uniref:Uncharacterized protein n=1 Tax=Corynebacterium kalinowskii TaxID=2675216 RepID=A0A6B8VDA9_9CORY|nr:DUF6474 family protein [Corynebacterium kalinowskii]QGU01039.1 hypothetical protein CKALI_00690 [Corynebacterium kalinowskii]
MGVFEKIRKARAKTKAEVKAAKTRAKAEVKAAQKDRARQQKLLAQQEHKLLKAEQKGLKARRKQELKIAKTELEKRKAGKINKANVQRYVGVARMLTPVLLPLIYKASTQIQESLTKQRAQKHGVSAAEMSQFAGHGATLKARIAGLRKNAEQANLPRGFVLDVKERLDELDKAVDNAEFMTPEQRRRAHRSIIGDIDLVAGEIQKKLV